MFKNSKEVEAPRQATGATIIAAGTCVTGNIESDNDIRIDGKVIGKVNCKSKVVIGSEGTVEGDITCKQADIIGTVIGNILAAESMNLRGKANLNGDITTNSLQVEAEVIFVGNCKIGSVHRGKDAISISSSNKSSKGELLVAGK